MNFAGDFYKDGIQLVAIDPMGEEPTRASFFNDVDKMSEWVGEQNQKFNIYFTVNKTKSKNKKSRKEHITEWNALWVDIDPDKNEDRELERIRIEEELKAVDLHPSVIIDSGNGYAAYWYFDKPIKANSENNDKLERLNIALAKIMKGDSCHNVDRIMRLPETVNYPTPSKIRAGYEESNAKLYYANGHRYNVKEIISWVKDKLPEEPEAEKASDKMPEVNNDKLNVLLEKDDAVKSLWKGTPTDNQQDTSRSGFDMTLVALLKSRGLTEQEVHQALFLFEHGKINEAKFPNKYSHGLWESTHANQPLQFLVSSSKLIDRYAYIVDQDKFYDGKSGIFLTATALNNKYIREYPGTKKCPKAAEVLLNDEERIVVDTVTWLPSDDKILKEGGAVKLNLYVQPTMEVKQGDATPWLEHLEFLISDKDQSEHLLNWMAFMMQHPEKKINHQVLMAGNPRIGKDMLFVPIVEYFGQQNVAHPQAEQMHGSFNEYLNGKKLIMVEEIMNYEKRTYENQLKPLCAAPPKFLHINVKGLRQYEIHNVCALVFFSNEPDAISIRTKGDTRYFCLWSGVQPKSPEYYTELWRWMHDGGNEIVSHYLLNRDVSDFNHGTGAPETEYRKEIGYMSTSGKELTVTEAIQCHSAPFEGDLVTTNDVVEAFKESGINNIQMAGRLLRRAGAVKHECVYEEDKKTKKMYLWSVRNHEIYDGMSKHDVVKQYKDAF